MWKMKYDFHYETSNPKFPWKSSIIYFSPSQHCLGIFALYLILVNLSKSQPKTIIRTVLGGTYQVSWNGSKWVRDNLGYVILN